MESVVYLLIDKLNNNKPLKVINIIPAMVDWESMIEYFLFLENKLSWLDVCIGCAPLILIYSVLCYCYSNQQCTYIEYMYINRTMIW